MHFANNNYTTFFKEFFLYIPLLCIHFHNTVCSKMIQKVFLDAALKVSEVVKFTRVQFSKVRTSQGGGNLSTLSDNSLEAAVQYCSSGKKLWKLSFSFYFAHSKAIWTGIKIISLTLQPCFFHER